MTTFEIHQLIDLIDDSNEIIEYLGQELVISIIDELGWSTDKDDDA